MGEGVAVLAGSLDAVSPMAIRDIYKLASTKSPNGFEREPMPRVQWPGHGLKLEFCRIMAR